MAIKKEKQYKGNPAEYWMIIKKSWNKITETTECSLALYFSKAVRRANINNYLEIKNFRFNGEHTTSQLYVKIKEPILNGVNSANTNWFSDAEDELEPPVVNP